MDRAAAVHIDNRILLSYEKEGIWACSSGVDEPRVCYIELKVRKRSIQVLYI